MAETVDISRGRVLGGKDPKWVQIEGTESGRGF